jgi:hypothetical protein
MPDLLDELLRRYNRQEPPRRKRFLKALLGVLVAIAVGIALNWLLWYFGINPFHIRDADW